MTCNAMNSCCNVIFVTNKVDFGPNFDAAFCQIVRENENFAIIRENRGRQEKLQQNSRALEAMTNLNISEKVLRCKFV